MIAAGGRDDRAILGGLMGQYATSRGVAALFVDGAVRDRSVLERLAPPVFATGLNHLGPYKDGPGELRGPVSLGEVAVDAGTRDPQGLGDLGRALASGPPRLRGSKLVAIHHAGAPADPSLAACSGQAGHGPLMDHVSLQLGERALFWIGFNT